MCADFVGAFACECSGGIGVAQACECMFIDDLIVSEATSLQQQIKTRVQLPHGLA